jgi:hypothetical protein
VLAGDGGGRGAGRGSAKGVLTGARAAVKRRRDGGREQRWLELIARAKEGTRELEREGKRGGEGWGCSSSFIGLGGRRRWLRLAGQRQ